MHVFTALRMALFQLNKSQSQVIKEERQTRCVKPALLFYSADCQKSESSSTN